MTCSRRTVLAPLRGPVWNYRRRARLGIKHVPRKGKVLVGFRERSAPFIADLRECHILVEPVGRLIEPLGRMVESLSILNRLPQAEVAVADDAVVFVLRVLDPPTAADLERMREFELAHDVRLYLQSGGPDTIQPLTPGARAAAVPYRSRRRDDRIPAHGLPAGQRRLERSDGGAGACRCWMRSRRNGCSTCSVASVISRCPSLAAPQSVVAVEGDAGLVERARANATRNGLSNVEFHTADLFKDVTGLSWAQGPYDRVLLDPPRAGAREILPIVAGSGARRVVYISCHAGSLARDAGLLVREHGFRLTAAGVMDMFPHTAHVEAMAVFDR